MIAFLLAAAQAPAAPAAEIWEPRLSWGCVVREGKNKPFVVNGFIAQRNEPSHPNVHLRFQRSLRVVRDDSGAFAGRQARPPMFVVHPKQYWAFFAGADGKLAGPGARSIILDKDAARRPVRIQLVAGDKPYASGDCVSRVMSPEIPQ